MNDKQAHNKLKKIIEENKSYKNSRRIRNEGHEEFNTALNDFKKTEQKRSA